MSSLFENSVVEGETRYVTCAAFHLGVPLTLAYSDKAPDWESLRTQLGNRISKSSKMLKVVEDSHQRNFRPPLGKPLALKFKKYSVEIPALFSFPSEKIEFVDHLIWVSPTGGIYLIILSRSTGVDRGATLPTLAFEQNRYPAFCALYLEILEELVSALHRLDLSFTIPSTPTLERNKLAMRSTISDRRAYLSQGKSIATAPAPKNLTGDLGGFALEDLLQDVYYAKVVSGMDKQDIGYVGATLETEDPERVYLLILMYTSFAASLWIMQALSDFANRAMEAFKGWKGGSLKRLSAIRSLRLFCESFIAEAQPIQVRLTEKYLEISEPIFKASRLPEIFSQISSQLTNLSQETEVIESKLSLSRDRKVGLAAAAIAVLSGLSAAYDLS